ncbi:hypothetical protein ACJJIK_03620 [Microbulbifer sp. ZKSA006]|uniref:hypothetical protein n=1 Tax=Microbulbifer sp. ZKSA006 TaxID=3243390 RepID=UPI0040399A20
MKLFLLRLLWISHGPIFRMAENQGAMLLRILFPVALVYFAIIHIFFHVLTFFIFGVEYRLSGMGRFYLLVGSWCCFWFLEVYIFREENIKKIKEETKTNKQMARLAEECMSSLYAFLWWSSIIVLFVCVLIVVVKI